MSQSKDEANADRFDLKSMPTFKDKPIRLAAPETEDQQVEWPMKVFYKEITTHSEKGDRPDKNNEEEDDCFMWPPESTADILSDEDQLIWLASQTPAMIQKLFPINPKLTRQAVLGRQ